MTQAELDTHDCTKGLEDGCTCDLLDYDTIHDTYDTVTGEHVQFTKRRPVEDNYEID